MKQLIKNIQDDEKIHYLFGYPAGERNKIVRLVKREFKTDVREISSLMHWKDIINCSERIKILIYTDKIINKHRLGEDFERMVNDGSIYLFFSRNRVHDFALRQHWFKLIKTLDNRLKYKYKARPKVKKIKKRMAIPKEPQIDYRRTASFISHLILIFLIFIYIANKSLRSESIGGSDWVLLTCTTLDVANLFLGFHVYRFLKKKLEPFISDQLKKNRATILNINKSIKSVTKAIQEFAQKVKPGQKIEDE